MMEKVFSGSRKYWCWMGFLALLVLFGLFAYLYQLSEGFSVTGLGRDLPWGLYISQLAFMVGVAASAVMVVLPYYLHDYKAFGPITLLGEFVAIPAVVVSALFVFVDIGHPDRVLNLFLHPSPSSPLFWDTIALFGYLGLNVVISMHTVQARAKGMPPPRWLKGIIILSIPWAVSIHTITAFIFSGLAARPFWMTAILAARFLASAFAAGPALLILLALFLSRVSSFRAGDRAIDKLAEIVTYALIANVFFFLLEVFTALYSGMPHHIHAFEYLFVGLDGQSDMVPFAWTAQVLSLGSLGVLLVGRLRGNHTILALSCMTLVIGLWLDKGLATVIAGFVPNPMNRVVAYSPTATEIIVSVGLYALGALIFSALCKIFLAYTPKSACVDHSRASAGRSASF